jgi:D-tyrosyl-tRNA(Tyr) deacylase
MRAIIQRVKRGAVSVDGETTGSVDTGLVVFIGATHQDTEAEAQKLAHKTAHLRIFEDKAGKMNLSALDVGAGILVVSQFTLYANCRKGRRPSFTEAALPDVAEPLIEHFVGALREDGVVKVETGVFRAHMLVEIQNDGPVTIILDTDEL